MLFSNEDIQVMTGIDKFDVLLYKNLEGVKLSETSISFKNCVFLEH